MSHQISLMDQPKDVQTMSSTILHMCHVCSTIFLRNFFKLIENVRLVDVHGDKLSSRTLCPSAQQYLSSHYNLHSMYGYFEAKASNMFVTSLFLSRLN